MKIDWHILFEAKTARHLTAAEAELWTQELFRDMKAWPPSQDDIKSAIRWAFDPYNIGRFEKPCKYDYSEPYLVRLIWQWREATVPKKTTRAHLDDYRHRIRGVSDLGDLWAIVCEPQRVEDVEALEAYAKEVHPEWRRPAGLAIDEIVAEANKVGETWTEEGDRL